MSSRVASFADDTKLYHRIDYPSDAENLQEDLHSLDRWSEVSGLVFNERECKCQRITRKRNPILFPTPSRARNWKLQRSRKALESLFKVTYLGQNMFSTAAPKLTSYLGFCAGVLLRWRASARVEHYIYRLCDPHWAMRCRYGHHSQMSS